MKSELQIWHARPSCGIHH